VQSVSGVALQARWKEIGMSLALHGELLIVAHLNG
jgi:hypothetical protein